MKNLLIASCLFLCTLEVQAIPGNHPKFVPVSFNGGTVNIIAGGYSKSDTVGGYQKIRIGSAALGSSFGEQTTPLTTGAFDSYIKDIKVTKDSNGNPIFMYLLVEDQVNAAGDIPKISSVRVEKISLSTTQFTAESAFSTPPYYGAQVGNRFTWSGAATTAPEKLVIQSDGSVCVAGYYDKLMTPATDSIKKYRRFVFTAKANSSGGWTNSNDYGYSASGSYAGSVLMTQTELATKGAYVKSIFNFTQGSTEMIGVVGCITFSATNLNDRRVFAIKLNKSNLTYPTSFEGLIGGSMEQPMDISKVYVRNSTVVVSGTSDFQHKALLWKLNMTTLNPTSGYLIHADWNGGSGVFASSSCVGIGAVICPNNSYFAVCATRSLTDKYTAIFRNDSFPLAIDPANYSPIQPQETTYNGMSDAYNSDPGSEDQWSYPYSKIKNGSQTFFIRCISNSTTNIISEISKTNDDVVPSGVFRPIDYYDDRVQGTGLSSRTGYFVYEYLADNEKNWNIHIVDLTD